MSSLFFIFQYDFDFIETGKAQAMKIALPLMEIVVHKTKSSRNRNTEDTEKDTENDIQVFGKGGPQNPYLDIDGECFPMVGTVIDLQ